MQAQAPILQAKNLVKRYGRVTAIDHCDFELYPGEILAVIGDNGAGKSSLIKALSGAITPDEGEVYLDDHWVFTVDLESEARIGDIELFVERGEAAFTNLRIAALHEMR